MCRANGPLPKDRRYCEQVSPPWIRHPCPPRPRNRAIGRGDFTAEECAGALKMPLKSSPRSQRYLNSYQPPVLTAFIAPNRESLTCLMRGQCASHRSKGFRTALRRCNTLLEQDSPTSVQPAPAVEILLKLSGHACEGGFK